MLLKRMQVKKIDGLKESITEVKIGVKYNTDNEEKPLKTSNPKPA